ncbi:MAG: insulinase family protein, partial [Deltaproteobacteria bacterium]|nr:insulinase family protein [Deltaproteobacteria bacterium]
MTNNKTASPAWLLGLLFIMMLITAGSAQAVENVDYTLSNGLKVIFLENHRAPVVSMLVWVKA